MKVCKRGHEREDVVKRCRECSELYYAKYSAANSEKLKLYQAKYSAALPDAYVVNKIIKNTNIPREMIPVALIETVRVRMQINRKLKEISNGTTAQ